MQNDSLGLRQPIRISSLTYLSSSVTHHLLTGTQLGDVRRYDTRAARRPVSDWKIGKGASISVVEKGIPEQYVMCLRSRQRSHPSSCSSELYVGNHTCDLFAIDLRNGRTMYRYTGLVDQRLNPQLF